jgi:antitoxin component of MazEF toxin-antitoxin module
LFRNLGRLLKEYDGNIDGLLANIDTRRTAKIQRSGNAEAVTIPQKWLKILNWAEGDLLMLRLDKSKGTVTLEKSKYQEKRAGQVSTSGQKSPI